MNCPRCGHHAHADRAQCPDCAWTLSQPFEQPRPKPIPKPVAAEVLSFDDLRPSELDDANEWSAEEPPVEIRETFETFRASPASRVEPIEPTVPVETFEPIEPVAQISPAHDSGPASQANQTTSTIAEFSLEDFQTGPRQAALWRGGNSSSLHRRLRRDEPRQRMQSLGSAAVAVLPDEARWEAPSKLEYIPIPLVQARLDFRPEDEAEQLAAQARAPVGARLLAAALDFGIAAKGIGLFIGLFSLMNGGFLTGRTGALIYVAAAFAITSAYFGFFTMTSTVTPGMRWRGLRAVTFEGKPLQFHHRLWRAFGYVVSTGTLLVGFLWAAVDEKRLTWHDYISGTFVTDRDDL